MAWQEALESSASRTDPADLLRRRLAMAEGWRRAGWVVMLVAMVAACAAGSLALAAVVAAVSPAAARLAGTYGRALIEALLLAPVAALFPALLMFVFAWRRAPTADLLQRLAGRADDELLTAAEALDG
ncbi:MAG: hypothetical protein J7M26_03240, partial [Armatimonadetes bacterium]|nr:hypothetical protein [Armatimonadota bacterium]